ncbi:uncharacterized protein JCM6883_000429 [Sporobolomyces salmoneus]|uniref:uncharacterized protein n=1 Tax=Sporobolomyces salmoneus TaxID=183962 RepID=UPI003172D9DF
MQSPQNEIRRVVRELVESEKSTDMLAAVEKYFAPDAEIVYPLLNSPRSSGREGVKACYKMLRVLTYGNKVEFNATCWDRIRIVKGVEHQTGFLDLVETLKFRAPVPEFMNPSFSIRFLIRVDLRKDSNDLWHIVKQEDSIPTDFASTGLRLFPFDREISNAIKFTTGLGTLVVGSTLTRLGWFN